MSYKFKLLILSCLLFSKAGLCLQPSLASEIPPIGIFIDPLYWKATEVVDWCYSNNLNASNQRIIYNTAKFHFDPGVRFGIFYEGGFDTKLSYTKFYTRMRQAASGNLTSSSFGGKIIQSTNNFFYQTGQITFTIDYNVVDLDLSKRIFVSDALMLRPIVGLRGAWINQHLNTNFQGLISISERTKNNFNGIGPKLGVETHWLFACKEGFQFSIFSNFATSYLWGDWDIKDSTLYNVPVTLEASVGNRKMGSLAVQGIFGIAINSDCYSLKLGYEITDWFDQYQVLDDGTGGHNNDLLLQGLTLSFSYLF